MFQNMHDNQSKLRVIQTARSAEAINEAARAGFRPLLRKVDPSPEIHSKFAVLQNRLTGEVEVIGDYRSVVRYAEGWDVAIDWTYRYPYTFESPFAAYLIPPDIATGERVFLEDLIEDLIGMRWNQGNTYRLENIEATWTGSDLELCYDPGLHRVAVVG
jgi:hypothetical protein